MYPVYLILICLTLASCGTRQHEQASDAQAIVSKDNSLSLRVKSSENRDGEQEYYFESCENENEDKKGQSSLKCSVLGKVMSPEGDEVELSGRLTEGEFHRFLKELEVAREAMQREAGAFALLAGASIGVGSIPGNPLSIPLYVLGAVSGFAFTPMFLYIRNNYNLLAKEGEALETGSVKKVSVFQVSALKGILDDDLIEFQRNGTLLSFDYQHGDDNKEEGN